jgi:hypothetical protein
VADGATDDEGVGVAELLIMLEEEGTAELLTIWEEDETAELLMADEETATDEDTDDATLLDEIMLLAMDDEAGVLLLMLDDAAIEDGVDEIELEPIEEETVSHWP